MPEILPYKRGPTWVLYHADALQVLRQRRNDTVDLVVADPPYFLSNGGTTCKGGRRAPVDKGVWDRSSGPADNHSWNLDWLRQVARILKKDGTIFVSGTRHNIFSVGYALQELGFRLLNDITWVKKAPPPNLSCRYFTHATETIIWAARCGTSKHTFNYATMKEENGGKQMTSVWRIGRPRKAETVHGKHPCQKPLELVQRLVRAASRPGDVVLDPFCGSSTTGVAALQLGRRFVGIDKDATWLDISALRCDNPAEEDGR